MDFVLNKDLCYCSWLVQAVLVRVPIYSGLPDHSVQPLCKIIIVPKDSSKGFLLFIHPQAYLHTYCIIICAQTDFSQVT